jgi:hypothetical protein
VTDINEAILNRLDSPEEVFFSSDTAEISDGILDPPPPELLHAFNPTGSALRLAPLSSSYETSTLKTASATAPEWLLPTSAAAVSRPAF